MNHQPKRAASIQKWMLGAALLPLTVPALAQSNNGTMNGGGMSGAPAMAMPTDTTTGTMQPNMTLSPIDRLFMTRGSEGNLAEIATSRLALKKSKNPGVLMVAQTLIREHGMAQSELMQTAMSKKVSVPATLSSTHQAVLMALQKAKGPGFDAMFMSGQLDDHENTIALFQSELALGQDPDAKAFATKYLPGIVGHTEMIYRVARQVGAPGILDRPASLLPSLQNAPGLAGVDMTQVMSSMGMNADGSMMTGGMSGMSMNGGMMQGGMSGGSMSGGMSGGTTGGGMR